MSQTAKRDEAEFYEIRLQGMLDESWSGWLGDLEIRPLKNGETVLAGPIRDQAALHGLLNKIRDLGLPLLSVERKRRSGVNEMAENRRGRVRLAVLCGAVALAAVLIVGGALALANAWVPVRVAHRSVAESTTGLAGTLPAKLEAADTAVDTGAERLSIRELPVTAAEVMGPGRFEYNDLLGDEILARIQALRTRAAERSLGRTNAALAPFGYRLESRFDPERNRTFYDLYREGQSEPLLAGLESIWPASVNGSGTDFVLVAENAPSARPLYVLVRNGQVEPWDPVPSAFLTPGYVGDSLARITATEITTITYRVSLGAQPVYTGTAVGFGAYMPLRSFTTWDDHWVLEVDDHLIMDGQDIGQALGYDAAFGFARIGAQSFYFFEQDGLVRISYDGQTLPNAYEQVFHNHCCEAAIHNVEAGPDTVWFHALREGTWYFVEAVWTSDENNYHVRPSQNCTHWCWEDGRRMKRANRLFMLFAFCVVMVACGPEASTPGSSAMQVPADQELALQSLVDFFGHLSAGRYQKASQLYGGPYEQLIHHNPGLDPQDHAALLRNACTVNGFQCLRVRTVRLHQQAASGAEFHFRVEFSTPDGGLFVRGPCCGASETDMPPQSEFLYTVTMSKDGDYRVQDLPVYVP
jgi:hypothetical protein